MAPFNYKNAYKLAIQTNRELHISLDAYKFMYDESQKEIQKCKAEIARLAIKEITDRLKFLINVGYKFLIMNILLLLFDSLFN